MLANLDAMAKDMGAQLQTNLYRSLGEQMDRAGRTVQGERGKGFTPELFFAALESLQIDFNQKGEPQWPELHVHPDMIGQLKKVEQAVTDDPALKARFDEIRQRKFREWNAREAARKLVG